MERQITITNQNHILTNTSVWSPDGRWIVYDVRSDPAGSRFDGTRIEAIDVFTGEVRKVFQSRNGAHCGVATCHPRARQVIFILGPEHPTPDWSYSACHRQGVIVNFDEPDDVRNMEARDLAPPFTPGALRGGTHVHVWDAAGDWISFTYNDALADSKLRDVGVALPIGEVRVNDDHPRNHGGSHFSMVISKTRTDPRPGSDDIQTACEESWIGARGYVRGDGSRSSRALAFQGDVIADHGEVVSEVYLCDLPETLGQDSFRPEFNGSNRRPTPPSGIRQRRLTYTARRRFPGLQGPRHWLRSAPDGSAIACLMKDDDGIVQICLVSPLGGEPRRLTDNPWPIASAFTWSPDGRLIAHAMDGSVCVTEADSGKTRRLTDQGPPSEIGAIRPEACVFSPEGGHIAYLRSMRVKSEIRNHIFCVKVPAL